MKKCKIVIGKNFGDEGKGKLTDFWAKRLTESGERVLVIKNNGGAQAGHTVEEAGFRFVFHQLGSGSYRGCPTFLGSSFFPDLYQICEESKAFEQTAGKKTPPVFVSGDCVFTLPFDVLLNSLLEVTRGKERHGSCGMGIYEARRRKEAGFGCTVGELEGKAVSEIAALLFGIREDYVRRRLTEIKIDKGTEDEAKEWLSVLFDDNVVENCARIFYQTVRERLHIVKPDCAAVAGLLKNYDTLLFENAQGLLLDEDNTDYFPHLTPSHTGLYNIRRFWERYGLERFIGQTSVCYVTRAYVTRHGAGRLDYECDKEDINGEMVDLTNVPNPWQNALRYAYHPPGEEFWEAIRKDTAKWQGELCAELYVTHLDETGGRMMFWDKAEAFSDFCRRQEDGAFRAAVKRLD